MVTVVQVFEKVSHPCASVHDFFEYVPGKFWKSKSQVPSGTHVNIQEDPSQIQAYNTCMWGVLPIGYLNQPSKNMWLGKHSKQLPQRNGLRRHYLQAGSRSQLPWRAGIVTSCQQWFESHGRFFNTACSSVSLWSSWRMKLQKNLMPASSSSWNKMVLKKFLRPWMWRPARLTKASATWNWRPFVTTLVSALAGVAEPLTATSRTQTNPAVKTIPMKMPLTPWATKRLGYEKAYVVVCNLE